MNWKGIEVGVTAFVLIGCFHPIVIRCEYYFSKAVWPVFGLVGLLALAGSLWISDAGASAIAAVFGITCLWSIKELFEQEKRVQKGWFPKNPNRKSEKTR